MSAGKKPPDRATRRRWLTATVAGTAMLAGAGIAWRERRGDTDRSDAEAALWRLDFESPASGTVRMQAFAGKPLLLNFWATWCPPCVDELPLLNSFYQQQARNGWQVVGIAADQKIAVDNFLRRLPLAFPVALAGMQGVELSRTLGNLGGALPFTVVLGSEGRILHRKMGRVTADDLQAWSSLR